MTPLTQQRAASILLAARDRKVLVVGDVILDHYVEGEVTRISPEAPVPVIKVTREWWALGGAANVAANVSKLGCNVSLSSVFAGDINIEYWMASLLHEMAVTSAMVRGDERHPTVKTRYLTPQQPLLRVDTEDTTPLSASVCGSLRDPLTEQINMADMVVVSDYAKGVVTQEVLDMVSSLCMAHGKPLCIGPKPREGIKYDTCNSISWYCLNEREYNMTNPFDTATRFVTYGEHGIKVFDLFSGSAEFAAHKVTEVDVCGAGDTVLAAVAVARLGGATPVEAAQLANAAAAVVVSKKGTATATVEETLAIL